MFTYIKVSVFIYRPIIAIPLFIVTFIEMAPVDIETADNAVVLAYIVNLAYGLKLPGKDRPEFDCFIKFNEFIINCFLQIKWSNLLPCL